MDLVVESVASQYYAHPDNHCCHRQDAGRRAERSELAPAIPAVEDTGRDPQRAGGRVTIGLLEREIRRLEAEVETLEEWKATARTRITQLEERLEKWEDDA